LAVNLLHEEVDVDLGGLGAHGYAEGVREGVCRVGAQDQGAQAAQGTERRRTGSGGRLADTALAGEEEYAHAWQLRPATRRAA
jgi:hypothetical protein